MTSRHQQDWEDLAQVDPYWAILSDPAQRFGRWDADAFFRTGELEFANVMQAADRLGRPLERSRALDFGCGLGRVTRAMATFFSESYGVDISETMLTKARELNAGWPRCKFVLEAADDLGVFPDNHFDMVYSNIVLQHLPTRALIERKIAEFVRVLKPGGLATFQLLSFIPIKYRIQPTRRAYGLLRALGFRHEALYKYLRLTPIRSNSISEPRVLDLLTRLGTHCLETQRQTVPQTLVGSTTYFFTK